MENIVDGEHKLLLGKWRESGKSPVVAVAKPLFTEGQWKGGTGTFVFLGALDINREAQSGERLLLLLQLHRIVGYRPVFGVQQG